MGTTNPHESRTAPTIAGTLDLDGTEYGAQGSTAPAPFARSFRLGVADSYRAPSVPALHDAQEDLASSHSGTGQLDGRRGIVTALQPDDHKPAPEAFTNERRAVVVNPEAPPARPRQGFTGADPTRAAQYQRPFLLRAFDKLIAEHPGAVLKAESAGPLAARSKDLGDIAGGQPYAGGSTGTQRAGIGPSRNSWRIMPKAWDALLVDTGGPAVSASNPDPAYTAASAQAKRSFRL